MHTAKTSERPAGKSNGHAQTQPVNILIVDPDSKRCALRMTEFAKAGDSGVVQCLMNSRDVYSVEGQDFDVCLFSVQGQTTEDFKSSISHLHSVFPDLKIIITEAPDKPEQIVSFIESGAWDYLRWRQGTRALVEKIQTTLQGHAQPGPDVLAVLMNRIYELSQIRTPRDTLGGGFEMLTPREREVLALISRRLTNREIAEELVLEVGTVKNHVHNLLKKLEVDNRYEAAALGTEHAPVERSLI